MRPALGEVGRGEGSTGIGSGDASTVVARDTGSNRTSRSEVNGLAEGVDMLDRVITIEGLEGSMFRKKKDEMLREVDSVVTDQDPGKGQDDEDRAAGEEEEQEGDPAREDGKGAEEIENNLDEGGVHGGGGVSGGGRMDSGHGAEPDAEERVIDESRNTSSAEEDLRGRSPRY